MRHPFLRLSRNWFPILFWPLLGGTIVLLIVMNLLSAALVNATAPQGIISFELARTTEKSAAILSSWDSDHRLVAAFSLGLDYLFIIVYATTLGLGCIWTSIALANPRLAAVGIVLAWMQSGAAIFDGIENFALFKVLLHGAGSILPPLVYYCAVLKFGIVLAGIIWCLVAAGIVLFMRRKVQ